MSVPTPHFLLFSAARRRVSATAADPNEAAGEVGSWNFVLESVDGKARIEVTEEEGAIAGERLELLAVIRGLEALDQPSRVTLVTASDYVLRGLRFGLPQWREDNWQWESFGRLVPVRNADLWQRLDRAMQIHQVRWRTRRIDSPAATTAPPRPVVVWGSRPERQATRGRGWLASLRELAARLLSRPGLWRERHLAMAR